MDLTTRGGKKEKRIHSDMQDVLKKYISSIIIIFQFNLWTKVTTPTWLEEFKINFDEYK